MATVRRTSSFLWRHSRLIRTTVAVALVLAAIASWRPAGEPVATRPVTVAARDIPSGATIVPEDLTTAADSLGLVTSAPAELVGEITRGPVAAGEPITAGRLSPGRAVPTIPGTRVVPLTLADTRIADLLVAGDRVDVVVTPDALHEGRPRTLARGAEVLAVPARSDEPAALGAGAVVLLAVGETEVADLAGIRRSDHVSIAIGAPAPPGSAIG